ncbi:MAG: hypothetical protein ACJAYG_002204 [Oceanicoccus sp.]|jgi:hypothetical protein
MIQFLVLLILSLETYAEQAAIEAQAIKPSMSDTLAIVGDAYSLGEEQLLYRELHFHSDDGLDHRIDYLLPDDSLMARKTLDYRSGRATPAYSQRSNNYPKTIDISWQQDQLLMSYASSGNPAEEKTLLIDQPLVIDAGFDHFVREHWADLIAGESLDFYFPAPSRLSLVELRATRSNCSYTTTTEACFKINSSNWLIRLLLDPIELGYNIDSKQLTRFRGLANMTDIDGNSLKVDIRYRYANAGEKLAVIDRRPLTLSPE